MVKAWKEAKVHADTTAKYEPVARAHGESVSMLSADWNQLLAAFKQKHGQHLHDTVLPAQSFAEAFEEMLSDGNLRAESLNQVVSVAEQEEQEQKKAEPQRHMSLHLDGQLSIQTERRFVSSVPTTPEQLRFNLGGICFPTWTATRSPTSWTSSFQRRTSSSLRTSGRIA